MVVDSGVKRIQAAVGIIVQQKKEGELRSWLTIIILFLFPVTITFYHARTHFKFFPMNKFVNF